MVRGMPLFLAALSASLFWIIALRIGKVKAPRFYGTVMLITAVLTYWGISSHIDRYAWQIDLQGNTGMCLCLILSVLLWTLSLAGEAERSRKTAAAIPIPMMIHRIVFKGKTRLALPSS